MQASRIIDWKEGDIYAPHDLSSAEANKRQRPLLPNKDIFDVLGINPLHEYKVNRSFQSKARENVH